MKITFILPGYPWKPMGGFRVVYEYANHLVNRGHEVTVVHPRRLPSSLPSTSIYKWLRRKIGYMRNLFFEPKVTWQPIDKRVRILFVPDPSPSYIPNADIVFATWWETSELVIKYPTEKGKKFYLVQDFAPYLAPKERLENTWREPMKKVCISSWLYNKVLDAGVSSEEVIAIPIGIDHKRFKLLKDIIKRPKRVLMMYLDSNYKATEDGLKALKICKDNFKDFEVFIFGSSYKLKIFPSWIKYMGNVSEEELVHLYNSSSIFISSSIAEGFALPPAEAMACGCAVVATDSGGIREYAENEKTALLSPPRDPESLSRNLLRLLKNDNLRIQIAKSGYEKIKEFTWERSTDLLEQFLLKHFRT